MRITIFRDGNAIRIDKAKGKVGGIIQHTLTYTRLRHPVTKFEREMQNNHIEYTDVNCYEIRDYKHGPQAVTNTGYLSRVTEALTKAGHEVRVVDLRPHPN